MPNRAQIEQARPEKNRVDPEIPYAYIHEEEPDETGTIRQVNTVFLTNSECPFRCLMCDLWKNTLDRPTPDGAVPRQIAYALDRLPKASVIKLYNSGNFFDRKAVPPSDYKSIAELVAGYERVIVENHPNLCGPSCREFSELIEGKLEIALGLETIHPEVLPRLNKQFTLDDFRSAAEYLSAHEIAIRTFLLLNPPYLTGREEGIEWALQSAKFAARHGSSCSTFIPTRPGNGIMEQLRREGHYRPPDLVSLEVTLERALGSLEGRYFADLWDLEQFASCPVCFEERRDRMDRMNREQRILPPVECRCEEQAGPTV